MMYAVQQYYHKSPLMYGGAKMLVKQEPMDSLSGADRPVDMSLSGRVHKTRETIDNLTDRDLLTYESEKLYENYINSYQQQTRLKSEISVHKTIDHVRMSPLTNQPFSMSSVMASQEINDIHMKSSDERITVPAVLTTSGVTTSFSSVDLVAAAAAHQRAKREFVPDNKKDNSYWCKRLKNNDSARRSRVKRKAMEKLMESKLLQLQTENIELKHELAALRRRFGEEEASSSDSSSSREKTSTSSPPSPPSPAEETSSKGEDENQNSGSDDARSSDDSRAYSVGSVNVLSHSLGPAGRDRADSIGSSSSSLTSSRNSGNSRPDSRNSQVGCFGTSLRADVTGALDLTNDQNSRSMSSWGSSSPQSFTSINTHSTRRNSCVSSDSSGMDDASTRIMIFPLKCRWKKGMHSAH